MALFDLRRTWNERRALTPTSVPEAGDLPALQRLKAVLDLDGIVVGDPSTSVQCRERICVGQSGRFFESGLNG